MNYNSETWSKGVKAAMQHCSGSPIYNNVLVLDGSLFNTCFNGDHLAYHQNLYNEKSNELFA